MVLSEILKFLGNKFPLKLRARIFLWYYRILHTTFGGVTIDSNGQLSVNKYWKVYGIIFGLASGTWNCVSIYLFQWAPIMRALYESGFITNYYMSLTMKALVEIRCIFLFWSLQTHGLEFFRTFFVYSIEKSRILCQLFFVWILHILLPIAVGVYQLYELKRNQESVKTTTGFYRIFFVLFQSFLNFSVSWSISFLMWNISICAFENLKKVENNIKNMIQQKPDQFELGKVHPLINFQKLNQSFNKREVFNSSKAIFFDIKRQVQALDKSISWAVVVDMSVTILVIMFQIYALLQNSPIIKQYATIIGFTAVSEIIRLVINCWINGLVYEKTDQIMALLDDFNTTDLDQHMYRQVIAFKTMSREISFGFTVGGFAPLRKTTLLSIFSFMMNYAVILMQTAKYL